MLNHLLIQEGATHPPTRATYLWNGTHTTPHHTIPHRIAPYYATAATHPSTPATRRLKGADPYSAKRIYIPTLRTCGWTCVWVDDVRVYEGENFETNGEFMASRGFGFLSTVLFRPSFKAAHLLQTSSRESLSEVPAREVILRTTPLLRTLAARFVPADWMMHGYVHDVSPFANPGDPAVKSVRFDYLTVARKMRDVDGARRLRLTHH